MSPETIAIIGTGIALAAAIIPGQYAIHREIGSIHRGISDLRERIARLEGAVELLTRFLIDRERGREAQS